MDREGICISRNNGWQTRPVNNVRRQSQTSIYLSDFWKILSIYQYTFKIYPNPANSYFNISLLENVDRLKIYDISGRLVKNIKISNKRNSLSLSDIKTGIYFVRVWQFTRKINNKKINYFSKTLSTTFINSSTYIFI
ncbi:MAG: T9SS type A sorting domain-containing protein [candidate division WOR-3 bacterium]